MDIHKSFLGSQKSVNYWISINDFSIDIILKSHRFMDLWISKNEFWVSINTYLILDIQNSF